MYMYVHMQVLSIPELHKLIMSDVNKLISEAQLAFILKTLNNTGLVRL